MVSALGSRVRWTPACKERTNDSNQQNCLGTTRGSCRSEKWQWQKLLITCSMQSTWYTTGLIFPHLPTEWQEQRNTITALTPCKTKQDGAPASTQMRLSPWRPAVTLTYDLQNLIRSSVEPSFLRAAEFRAESWNCRGISPLPWNIIKRPLLNSIDNVSRKMTSFPSHAAHLSKYIVSAHLLLVDGVRQPVLTVSL